MKKEMGESESCVSSGLRCPFGGEGGRDRHTVHPHPPLNAKRAWQDLFPLALSRRIGSEKQRRQDPSPSVRCRAPPS